MSSSEDDLPLAKGRTNGVKSSSFISPTLDRTLDKQIPSSGTHGAISIRNGPIEKMDVDDEKLSKRKSRPSKSYKDASSSDDDDKPLSKKRKTIPSKKEESDDSDVPLSRKSIDKKRPPKVTAAQVGEDDDSDVPIIKKLAKEKVKIEKRAAETAKKIRANDAKSSATTKNKKSVKEESDSDVPLAKSKKFISSGTKTKQKTKEQPDSAKKSKVKPKEEEEENGEEDDDEYRWWEKDATGDGTQKWTTLEHNGVVFPPPYQKLPNKVKLIYDGVPVSLHPDAEEVATFYGGMLNSTVNVENPTFNKNFFSDFKAILDKTGQAKDSNGKTVKINSFEKCNFTKIFEYFDTERAKKKTLSSAEKKAIKAEKDKAEEPYLYCKWDGRKEKVGNFRVEPPSLFRGRGDHPKTGRVKLRVLPEQITINIGKDAKVPEPPAGHKWKEVKHDNTGTWLATWQENINGNYKYVMLAANSAIKGQSDFKKFEKARELKKHIDKIRKDYTAELKSPVTADRQRATAIYLIDKLALRAGNEKGEDEAETVGCCSLKFEHVTLKPPRTVVFDFLGKDSIRYHDEVEVEPQVFKNLKIFRKEPKSKGDDIFDRLTTTALNKHLTSYMPGLTAKVFRTYNASWTMASLLKDMKVVGNVHERVKFFNDANRRVAILCNHKRTVGAAHDTAMEKINTKIDLDRYHQWRLRMQMLGLDSKLKKKKGAEFFEKPEDLTDDKIAQLQEFELNSKKEAIDKKFKKDNEKLAAEGSKPLTHKDLKERMEEVDDLEKVYQKENKTGKVQAPGKATSIEKLEKDYERIGARVDKAKHNAEEKEDNKEIALGTSKTNYIDPRLSVVFSKKFDVPIERLFSKTLREKFDWAIKMVDADWEF